MKVDKTKEVCHNRSVWRDINLCLHQRQKGVIVCMYEVQTPLRGTNF